MHIRAQVCCHVCTYACSEILLPCVCCNVYVCMTSVLPCIHMHGVLLWVQVYCHVYVCMVCCYEHKCVVMHTYACCVAMQVYIDTMHVWLFSEWSVGMCTYTHNLWCQDYVCNVNVYMIKIMHTVKFCTLLYYKYQDHLSSPHQPLACISSCTCTIAFCSSHQIYFINN